MPRDGSGVYTKPYPSVVSGTTIESLVYNGQVDDVAQDLNTPRPISAGGTGASSAAGAAANLGVVTGKAVMTYTDAEKTQARSNIYAAPLDALAYNGMQVNGSMEVSQERGTAAISTNAYILDGWRVEKSGTSAISAAQSIASPFSPLGFGASVGISVTTAQVSLGGTDYCILVHPIEGYRISRLALGGAYAQSFTVSFWTAHTKTGTYSVAVRNGNNTRSCAATYTQNVSNTPEYKTVTFPGDATGTWTIDNTVGLTLVFAIANGYPAAPATGTWYGANYFAASGQVNGLDSTSNSFRLTGVVVLPGTQAPSATQSPLIMRPYDQELLTCQRYFKKFGTGMGGTWISSSVAQFGLVLEHEMRALATGALTTASPAVLDPATAVRTGVGSTIGFDYTQPRGIVFSVTGFSGATQFRPAFLTDDYVKLDARL